MIRFLTRGWILSTGVFTRIKTKLYDGLPMERGPSLYNKNQMHQQQLVGDITRQDSRAIGTGEGCLHERRCVIDPNIVTQVNRSCQQGAPYRVQCPVEATNSSESLQYLVVWPRMGPHGRLAFGMPPRLRLRGSHHVANRCH